MGRTGFAGRGQLPRWGPNHAVTVVVTRWVRDAQGRELHDGHRKRIAEVVLLKSKQTGKYFLPSGSTTFGATPFDDARVAFAEAEGPGAVADFLDYHPEFRIDAPAASASAGIDWAALAVPMGYRTWPHRHDMDGFFAARLRRA